MTRTMNRLLGAATLWAGVAHAQAHDGHGMPGIAHWHMSDVLVFIACGVAVVVAAWLAGRK